MAKETECKRHLVTPAKEKSETATEETSKDLSSDGASLSPHASASPENILESFESCENSSAMASVSNSASIDPEFDRSSSQQQDYWYDDDVPFSYYAPLGTKERTAPLKDHYKSKKQKKQEKKERKNQIKKERQEVQQHRLMEQQEKDLEAKATWDESIDAVPKYRLAITMAGLAVSAVAAPHTNQTFLYDDGDADNASEDEDDDDEEFSLEGLESIKIAKSKRRSLYVKAPPPPKKKSSKKKKAKKRGRRIDFEEQDKESDDDSTDGESEHPHPDSPSKDVAARVEAIFTNKSLILKDFDEYIERKAEESKELEDMLNENKRGRSNKKSDRRGRRRNRSMGDIGHKNYSMGDTAPQAKTKKLRRGKKGGMAALTLDDSIARPLSTSRKLPKRSRSFSEVTRTRKAVNGPKAPRQRKKDKLEALRLNGSGKQTQSDLKAPPKRRSSFSGSTKKLVEAELSTLESPSKARKTKKLRKGKKGGMEALTLDDSVARPLSTSRKLPKRSHSFSEVTKGSEACNVNGPTHDAKNEKSKLSKAPRQRKKDKLEAPALNDSGKQTQSDLSAPLGRRRSFADSTRKLVEAELSTLESPSKARKTKKPRKGKKGGMEALTLDDSVARPLSTSRKLPKRSHSFSEVTRGSEAVNEPTHDTKNEKSKLSKAPRQRKKDKLEAPALNDSGKQPQSDLKAPLGRRRSFAGSTRKLVDAELSTLESPSKARKTKKPRKGKKGGTEALTLDDSVARPLSTSRKLPKRSNSFSEVTRGRKAVNGHTNNAKNKKSKLSKAPRQRKKDKLEALALNDSGKQPQSDLKAPLGRRRSFAGSTRKLGESEVLTSKEATEKHGAKKKGKGKKQTDDGRNEEVGLPSENNQSAAEMPTKVQLPSETLQSSVSEDMTAKPSTKVGPTYKVLASNGEKMEGTECLETNDLTQDALNEEVMLPPEMLHSVSVDETEQSSMDDVKLAQKGNEQNAEGLLIDDAKNKEVGLPSESHGSAAEMPSKANLPLEKLQSKIEKAGSLAIDTDEKTDYMGSLESNDSMAEASNQELILPSETVQSASNDTAEKSSTEVGPVPKGTNEEAGSCTGDDGSKENMELLETNDTAERLNENGKLPSEALQSFSEDETEKLSAKVESLSEGVAESQLSNDGRNEKAKPRSSNESVSRLMSISERLRRKSSSSHLELRHVAGTEPFCDDGDKTAELPSKTLPSERIGGESSIKPGATPKEKEGNKRSSATRASVERLISISRRLRSSIFSLPDKSEDLAGSSNKSIDHSANT